MRVALLLFCLAALPACGVDGAPERPEPGVQITGEAQFGVVKR